jgi:hypothetical protein
MKPGFAAASLLLVSCGSAFGHRLDEYLQAAIISVGKDRVQAQIHLTPGVAVFRHVMAVIDSDGDGVISSAEQRRYADRVLGDVTLSVDSVRQKLQLISASFPGVDEMKEGLGEIQLDFAADLPGGGGPERRLVFENRHQSAIASYLVNCLAPRDPDIRITAQTRNVEQSHYRLDYLDGHARPGPLSYAWWSGSRAWAGSAGLLVVARLAALWRARGHSQATSRPAQQNTA